MNACNYNMISLVGYFTLMCIAWLFSNNRKVINWKVIIWGTVFQFLFAYIIFHLPVGLGFFRMLNDLVIKLIDYSRGGLYFVFGRLSVPPGCIGPQGEESLGFILAFQALPTIIFFSALMSFLYYLKIMPAIIKFFADLFSKFMRISGAESLCATSNIFVGVEAMFTVRPYLEKMTNSELMTILTAGMATIASSVLGLYTMILHKNFPMIAGHLISASFLSAPAAIICSKILYPETETPLTLNSKAVQEKNTSANWIEAIIQGSGEGARLCLGIISLLLAFLGFLAMANALVAFLSRNIALFFGLNLELSIEKILSFIYYPITLLLGVPAQDAFNVSGLLGERTILTELVSYQHLNDLISAKVISDSRAIIITVYCLCGFAHIASLAIFAGGIAGLCPSRVKDIARVSFRSLLAATFACLMTGAVAGIFYTGRQVLLF